jgi:tRNA(Ile)-lysidine synthase
MAGHSSNVELAARLTADWPTAQWAGVHVLAAISGGADSMALLRGLLDARAMVAGAGRIFVGHVNHQTRGAASDADESWLRDECLRLDAPLMVRKATPSGETQQASASEAALRDARYRLLTAMAEEVGARFVAVAHTRDDQIETVLFRLLRGSGLRGLAGMPRARVLSPSVTLVRPLLACSRPELRASLTKRGQSWREDATNADFHFARNRLRHDILPRMRELFDVDNALLGAATQASEMQRLLEPHIEEISGACAVHASPTGVTLNAAALAEQPQFLVAEVLRHVWRGAVWPEQAMNRRWWTLLAELAQGPGDAPALNLPGNVLARKIGKTLVLERPGERI